MHLNTVTQVLQKEANLCLVSLTYPVYYDILRNNMKNKRKPK